MSLDFRRTTLAGALAMVAASCTGSATLPGTLTDVADAATIAPDGTSDASTPGSDCGHEGDPFAEVTLRERVAFLSSNALSGRSPGSSGDLSARASIESRFRCLGLTPGGDDGSYAQAFVDDAGHATANLIGVLPGSDPLVASDIVVVGAHHDHLGIVRGSVHPGANDNASGVTTLLAIAQAISSVATRPRRTIAFVAFGAEESGLEGSKHYAANAPRALPMDRVVYMVNLDMVGSYGVERTVYALGSFPGTPARALLEAHAAEHATIHVSLGEPGDESDHVPFCSVGIPHLFLWTPGGSCYHAACDTADRLDYGPMAEIGHLVTDVTRDLASSTSDLASVRRSRQFTCTGGR